MLKLKYSNQFKKITKLPIPDIVEAGHVIKKLQNGETLPEKYFGHALSGNWKGYRDFHIKPDLILVYKID
jgi:mRNA interferase YafQ